MAKSTTHSGSRQAKIQAAQKKMGRGANKIVIAAAVVIVAIVAVVAFVVIGAMQKESGKGPVPPNAGGLGQGFVANKSVTLAPKAPTLDVYEDFQCPICGVVESKLGPTISQLADSGKIKLVYHFKTVIDSNYRVDHSLKAASAAMCAADEGAFEKFHQTIYANMPQEEGSGWTDAQLTDFAKQAGITGDKLSSYQSCMDKERYQGYIQSTEESSAKAGINGTPTLKLGGQPLTLGSLMTDPQDIQSLDAALLKKAVQDATK